MKVDIHSHSRKYHYRFDTADTGIIGVYGISGSGKSSLLDALAGYQNNVKGLVEFNQNTLLNTDAKQHSKVIKCSYMNQHPILFPHWSVIENLQFASKYSNNADSLDHLLDKLQCTDLINKYPEQLSGGEKQRIAFIRALILIEDKGLMLLDEPFSALDRKMRSIAIDLLNQYKKTCLIYLVTHKISEIYQIADEVLYIKEGKIDYHDSIVNTMSSAQNHFPIASKIVINNNVHIIYADDVSISLQYSSNSSIVHQLDVFISAINILDDIAILKLKTNNQEPQQLLFAKITTQSLNKLNLTNNLKVVANFKATSYGKQQ